MRRLPTIYTSPFEAIGAYIRLMSAQYIWKSRNWQALLMRSAGDVCRESETSARREAEMLSGFIDALSTDSAKEAHAALITDEGTNSNAIEGVALSRDSFFASALQRLGSIPRGQVDRRHTPVIEALIDATENAHEPLKHHTLHRWQQAVLANQANAYIPALTGMYRGADDEMQIVTRPVIGKELVHYTAPPADAIDHEMQRLLDWVNSTHEADTFAGAAIAHLWFEIIHPYEDGNGRVGRLLWDRQIARAAANAGLQPGRWWSISHQIARDVKPYYDALNAASTRREAPDHFARWGLKTATDAFKRTRQVARDIVRGRDIIAHSAGADLNQRQRDILGLLVKFGSEGFGQGLSVRKYCSLTNASRATASRDLSGLVDAGFLRPRGEGRSRMYDLMWEESGAPRRNSSE